MNPRTMLLKWLSRAPDDSPRSYLRAPFEFTPTPDRWIFILGCYNSGTTLLDRVLQAHPAVEGLPEEGVALTEKWSIPGDFGWPRMWYQCRDQLEKNVDWTETTADRIRRDWSLWLGGQAPNVVQKSIVNTLHADFLEAYFQPAYFVHVIRNGYAVAEGIRRKANLDKYPNPRFDRRYPVERTARQWEASQRLVGRKADSLSRYKRIYYESLTENTERTLGELTKFLGIEPFDSSVFERQWSIQQYNEPIRNLNENNISNLTGPEIETIRDEVGPALERHGYNPPDRC